MNIFKLTIVGLLVGFTFGGTQYVNAETKLQELERKKRELESQISAKEAELGTLLGNISSMQSKVGECEAVVEGLTSQLAGLVANHKSLQDKYSRYSQDIVAKKGAVSSLGNSISLNEKLLKQEEGKLAAKALELAEVEKEYQALLVSIPIDEAKIAELGKKLQEAMDAQMKADMALSTIRNNITNFTNIKNGLEATLPIKLVFVAPEEGVAGVGVEVFVQALTNEGIPAASFYGTVDVVNSETGDVIGEVELKAGQGKLSLNSALAEDISLKFDDSSYGPMDISATAVVSFKIMPT